MKNIVKVMRVRSCTTRSINDNWWWWWCHDDG